MKPYLIIFFGLLMLAASCSKKYVSLERKTIGANFKKVTDSLYAQETEVTNQQFQEFRKYLLETGKGQLDSLYFDSTGWREKLTYQEPMMAYYHRHPAYMNYPAVNVSYEGATAYCQWLTEMYNANPKRSYKKVIFRLPTEEEWKLAARGRYRFSFFPWGGPYMRNDKGDALANFHVIWEADIKDTVLNGEKMAVAGFNSYAGIAGSLNDNGFITAPAKSYWPNDFGLYNMSGNVSEMLAEKGRVKGGSWRSMGYYLRIDAEDEYGGQSFWPRPYVGFRVFAEIVEK